MSILNEKHFLNEKSAIEIVANAFGKRLKYKEVLVA